MSTNSSSTVLESASNDGETAPVIVWIALILVACLSFWFQAVITEERFVPALNVIANTFNIPDDVAGATLMAAGASSPELFSSIVSLFITHSALGLGTIVGSEIFNQLIICAGAVYAAKSGTLHLDPAILCREVGFYLLSIILLYLALQDSRPVPDDDVNHIFISFWDATMVFSGYIAYVLVCANMDSVVNLFTKIFGKKEEETASLTETVEPDYGSKGSSKRRVSLKGVDTGLPFLREKSIISQPVGNFRVVEYDRTKTGEKSEKLHDEQEDVSFLAKSIRNAASTYTDGGSLRRLQFILNTEKPSDDRGLHDVEHNNFEERLSCFMWQRSYFYSKARFATRGWHLRWFSLFPDHMVSVPDRANFERHRVKYPPFREFEVDYKRLIIRLIHPSPDKRSFYLMAPDEDILDEVVVKMEIIAETNIKNSVEPGSEPSVGVTENFDTANEVSLITFPADGSNTEIVLFVLLFPLRCMIHYTVPDVRVEDSEGLPLSSTTLAFIAVIACLVWLVIGSYAMVASLETLGDLLDIPAAVLGVTVSAAGTSLPNYVASKVAAEKGFGNMAVSNAFGSNTFNIMVGLGLPWMLYTSLGTNFEPYDGLRDEGIATSVIILFSVLLLFIVLVFPFKFMIYKWQGILFIVLYIAYLAFEIGSIYF